MKFEDRLWHVVAYDQSHTLGYCVRLGAVAVDYVNGSAERQIVITTVNAMIEGAFDTGARSVTMHTHAARPDSTALRDLHWDVIDRESLFHWRIVLVPHADAMRIFNSCGEN